MSEFHERLYNLRYHEMNIKSKEAAAVLGISSQLYSHYEKGRNRFPTDLLPKLKNGLGLSDELFLELILGLPSKRRYGKEIKERSLEIQEAYLTAFAENYFELINEPEIRELLAIIKHSSPEVRAEQLREIRTVLNKSKTFQLGSKKTENIQYKLNKQQTWTLVDGDVFPKSFMKTDDVAGEAADGDVDGRYGDAKVCEGDEVCDEFEICEEVDKKNSHKDK